MAGYSRQFLKVVPRFLYCSNTIRNMKDQEEEKNYIPTWETRLNKLLQQEEAIKQTVRTQKTNLTILDRLLAIMLYDMESSGNDDYIPENTAYLYRSIGLLESTFERNYSTMNGMIVLTKAQIIKDIDTNAIGAFRGFSYDVAITKLFSFLAQDQEKADNSAGIRLNFALRRFNEEFWATALHGFYPLIAEEWGSYSPDIKEFLFGWFAVCLRIVLILWSKRGFALQNVDDCKKLINLIGFIGKSRVQEIEDAMSPFLQQKEG